jgi:hypothetical protein
MVPRKRLTSVPQAMNANNVVGDGHIDVSYNSNTTAAVKIGQSGTGKILSLYDGSTSTGVEIFSVLDGGKVGIGNTNPIFNLQVAGTLGIGGTAYFGGNVGIGTTSPSDKLQVAGNIRLDNSGSSSLIFRNAGTYKGEVKYDSLNDSIRGRAEIQ